MAQAANSEHTPNLRRRRNTQAEVAEQRLFENPDVEWLTYEETAKLMRVTRRAVEKWVALQRLPAHRPNGWNVRFNKAEVEAWLSRKRRLKL